jgi:hypothetical protein
MENNTNNTLTALELAAAAGFTPRSAQQLWDELQVAAARYNADNSKLNLMRAERAQRAYIAATTEEYATV